MTSLAMNGNVEEAPLTPSHKPATKKVVVLLVVLGALIASSYVLPVRSWLKNTREVGEAVRSLGAWVYPVGAIGIAAMVACGVPRLLLCAAAAGVLGFWRGFALAEAGTVIGYYGVFLFVRWGGREWALHRWPKLAKWSEMIRDQKLLGVILLRQIPIHGTLINLSLGISHVKHRHFLIGTAVGVIPESIPLLLVGASLAKGDLQSMAKYIGLAVAAFVVIWIVLAYVMRAAKKSKIAGAVVVAEAAMHDGAE